jgi:aryl-alcohol dehydrogenase-like predicted oxidoreductase
VKNIMELMRQLGQSDLFVYPIALGTSAFGWTTPNAVATDQLNTFVERGGNFIDTADSYASGRSEQIIGTWMRVRDLRDTVVVATKVGKHPDASGLSARALVQGVDASLARLQTDRIDLLYFDAEDASVSLEESLGAAGQLIAQGKVRYLAASSFSATGLVEARVLASGGLPRFEAASLEYSVMTRGLLEGELEMVAHAQQISLVASANLTHDKIGRRGGRILAELDDIAMSHGVDLSTVALAWALGRPGVTAATIDAATVTELEALMHATSVHLTGPQERALTDVSD